MNSLAWKRYLYLNIDKSLNILQNSGAMKALKLSFLILIMVFLSASCSKELKNLKEEVRLLKQENNFLKADNISLKKEIEELYKKLDERLEKEKEAQLKKEEPKEPAKAKDSNKHKDTARKKPG